MLLRVCAMLGIGLISNVGMSAAQAPPDGLKLFTAMMPVFTSVRCSNCHGGVNPVSGDGHDGGAVPDAEFTATGEIKSNENCRLCHDAALKPPDPGWRLPPKRMNFVGKDAQALCRQMRAHHEEGEVLIDHLRTDYLVGLGFQGQRGGAAKDTKPPPMTRDAFLKLATIWTEEGDRGCGDWNGTVTYRWTEESTEPETLEYVTRTTTVQDKFELKIDVKDGTATPEITGKSVTVMDQRAKRPFCGNTKRTETTTVTWKTPANADVVVKPLGGGKYLIQVKTADYDSKTVTKSDWTAGNCPLFTDGGDTHTYTITLPGYGTAIIDDLIQFASLTGGDSSGYVLEGSQVVKGPGDGPTVTRTVSWKLTRK